MPPADVQSDRSLEHSRPTGMRPRPGRGSCKCPLRGHSTPGGSVTQEALETGAAVAIALGLMELVKYLVTKVAGDGDKAAERSVRERIYRFAQDLEKHDLKDELVHNELGRMFERLTETMERQTSLLETMDRRLERLERATK